MGQTSASKKKIITIIIIAAVIAAVVIALLAGSCSQKPLTEPEQNTQPVTEQPVTGQQAAAQEETVPEETDGKPQETTANLSRQDAASKEKPNKKDTAETDKKDSEDTASETKAADDTKETDKTKGVCKLTINNGAASANTTEAVNGLHVYDPNSQDKEDFFSGQEVPVGTTISIYVYNLATPVSLHVEHNGQVIADRTYSVLNAWVDDDKVEFIDLVLEGDLVVETRALSKSAKTSSVISINNEALGSVEIGKQQVHDGNEIRNGAESVKVTRADMDVNVTLSVDGTVVGTAVLNEGSPSRTFKNVSFNNSRIDVNFSPVDKNEKPPEPPKKSMVRIKKGKLAEVYQGKTLLHNGDQLVNGTYDFKVVSAKKDVRVTLLVGGKVIGRKKINAGMNSYTFKNVAVDGKVVFKMKDVTPKAKANKFKITLDNKVAAKDGTLTVGYVNEKEQAVEIVSGKTYKKELMIGARALNYNSSRKLKLTAYGSNGKVLDSVTIKTGSKKNPGANGFYLLLTDNIRFVLEYAGSGSEEKPTEPETKPQKEEEQYSVKVENGAAAANTDNAVNGLHVYDTGDPDLEDIEGTVKLDKGAKIRIFAYPLASDIHIRIVHNGVVIADKDIAKIRGREDDDKIEFFDITLAGDLVVTTTVKEEKPTEPETKEPETKEPETKEPETKQPETKEPETKEPTTKNPETKEPETKEPTTKNPETKEPETKEPTTKESET